MTHHIDLDAIVLKQGKHDKRGEGVCFMEAVAWFAGKPLDRLIDAEVDVPA